MTTAFDVWLLRLRSDLDYEPELGEFTWKRRFRRRGANRSRIRAGSMNYKTKVCVIGFEGKYHTAGRLAYVIMNGRWPEGTIRFVNGDWTDLRWANLKEKL